MLQGFRCCSGQNALTSCMASAGDPSTEVRLCRSASRAVHFHPPPSVPVAVLPCCIAAPPSRLMRSLSFGGRPLLHYLTMCSSGRESASPRTSLKCLVDQHSSDASSPRLSPCCSASPSASQSSEGTSPRYVAIGSAP